MVNKITNVITESRDQDNLFTWTSEDKKIATKTAWQPNTLILYVQQAMNEVKHNRVDLSSR